MKIKRSILLFFMAFLLFAAGLGSCSANKTSMHDGYYSAEAAEFDYLGWKEYVTICVSNGQIILVEYNAFNSSGFVKSWDMEYMRTMNAASKSYPNAYTRYYRRRLLSGQGTDNISALSGATHSYHSFIKLADAALEKARDGNTETSLVLLDGVKY
ncbi:MAG: FMN-binding protein [Treponema sp.]|jgi:major membrane immunogen (membrane-anchored lipoprotein)|nr:FMN-binding protein [Treponema sp.]